MANLSDILQDDATPQKNIPGQKGKETVQSLLEKELAAEDSHLATELSRTRAQAIIAERKQRIAQIERQTGRGTNEGNNQSSGKDEISLEDFTMGILERGLDPKVASDLVGDLLRKQMGMPYVMPSGGGPPQQQVMTVADMISFFKLGQDSNKADPDIKRILEELKNENKEIKQQLAASPQMTGSIMVQQPDGSWAEVAKSTVTRVIPLPPKAETNSMSSLEELKEKNRHDEETERIKDQREYHQSIANTLADIPATITGAIAENMGRDDGEAAPRTQAARTQPFQCEVCGAKMQIPIGTPSFKCVKCGTVYSDKPPAPAEKEESKTNAG